MCLRTGTKGVLWVKQVAKKGGFGAKAAKNAPQELKPTLIDCSYGTTEVVP
jgi:hypothetical protein